LTGYGSIVPPNESGPDASNIRIGVRIYLPYIPSGGPTTSPQWEVKRFNTFPEEGEIFTEVLGADPIESAQFDVGPYLFRATSTTQVGAEGNGKKVSTNETSNSK
jgi:hypothetical protein